MVEPKEVLTCEDFSPADRLSGWTVADAAALQNWHLRMMDAAKYFGSWSKCLSRKIGAVIVEDKTIISTGYNGPPRNVAECNTARGLKNFLEAHQNQLEAPALQYLEDNWGTACPRQLLGAPSGTGLEYCIAGHAEANAIANAARKGVEVRGADMYCYCPLPCKECAKLIIGAGIKTVFHIKGLDYDTVSRAMLKEAHVNLIGISMEMIEKYEEERG